MRKSVNRCTVIKSTAATLAVASDGVPALAKAQFDPAAYVAACDKLGYVYTARVENGKYAALTCMHPDDYVPGADDVYFDLKINAREVEGSNRLIGEYLMSIGRYY